MRFDLETHFLFKKRW